METFIQALIVSFREGLEAFLIIAILLKFLDKTGNAHIKKSLWNGTFVGVAGSFIIGILLMELAEKIHEEFPFVKEINMSVTKLNAPIINFIGSTSVTYKKTY